MSVSPPAWHPDPTGRFEQRYWDGNIWTDHVWRDGQQLVDPVQPVPTPTRVVEMPRAATVRTHPPGTASLAATPARRQVPPVDQNHDPRFPEAWPPKKRAKKAAQAQPLLFPGEVVIFQCQGGTWKPATSDLVVTDLRIFSFAGTVLGLNVDLRAVSSVDGSGSHGRLTIEDIHGRAFKIGSIPPKELQPLTNAINRARGTVPSKEAIDAFDESVRLEAEALRLNKLTAAERWASGTVLGVVSKKSTESILRLCQPDEAPWLVLAPGAGQGVLAAFEDRLAIIKTGALTSFMAGSLGGERSTTFYFTDINAIEYNSGFASGVLEVLTASYQGSANKDYWRGTNQSRNADSNDPYTLSNTLPMAKLMYNEWAPHIQQLRAKIAEAKHHRITVVTPAPTGGTDLVGQLEKLASLHASGALTDEEYSAAKARLVAG